MKKRNLYILWGVLYCLCVGLSFTAAEGLGKTMLSALGIAFFGPPFYLLWQARKEEDRKTELVLRLISAIVLVLALLLLILNFLSNNILILCHLNRMFFKAPEREFRIFFKEYSSSLQKAVTTLAY